MNQTVTQTSAYADVNPVIVKSEGKIILAKRDVGQLEAGKWHLPGGRVLYGETLEQALKRIAKKKTNLDIELFRPSLKESLVGIYDDPERDPREHVISLAFLCRVTGGEATAGEKVAEVKEFSPEEIENIQIGFDHKKTVLDAFKQIDLP